MKVFEDKGRDVRTRKIGQGKWQESEVSGVMGKVEKRKQKGNFEDSKRLWTRSCKKRIGNKKKRKKMNIVKTIRSFLSTLDYKIYLTPSALSLFLHSFTSFLLFPTPFSFSFVCFPYASATNTSTSTPRGMLIAVMCFTISCTQRRSITRLWTRIWK